MEFHALLKLEEREIVSKIVHKTLNAEANMNSERRPLKSWNKRPRQRVPNTTSSCESLMPPGTGITSVTSNRQSPPELPTTQKPKNYATFPSLRPVGENPDLPVNQSGTIGSVLLSLISCCLCREKLSPTQRASIDHGHHVATKTWRIIMILSAVIALLAFLRGGVPDSIFAPEWHWDHNVYIPRSGDAPISRSNEIVLIAQVVTSRELRGLVDISSRPNRAYAREWGMDYARYDSGRSVFNSKTCFEKAFVLNTLMERQSKDSNDSPSSWFNTPRAQYDSLILLAPDSIITELDTNLAETMLPKEKLVAIAGWGEGKRLSSKSNVILFNLQHKHAEAVAKLWWEMVEPLDVTCGANNDLGLLITAIASVMDLSEDLDDLIEPLSESPDGYIGEHVMKFIAPSVPGSRSVLLLSNLKDSQATLQETADAVCYRFYPRCEVL